MYNNSTHYPSTGYQSAYPQYQQTYSTAYGYQSYGNQYANQAQHPVPPADNFSSENWNAASNYGLTQKDAVAQEMQQQKAQLTQQREDYVKKVSVLRHELEQLRMQKQELVGEGTSDRDLANILRENDKLQEEIQGKMKAIHNVIEMLSSIIKDGRTISDLEASIGAEEPSTSPPLTQYYGENHNKVQVKSQTPEPKQSPEKFCYVHYDTGLHWCRMCDDFPETAKDFLLHLQDKKHREMAKENDVDNTPWHKLPAEPVLPTDENAPKKRVPIKGLQFFISAPSWYCKLCDLWIGDLHCASHHLKSQTHYQNYENFVVQNPHWEMEWLKDREIAMSRNAVQESSDSETGKKKKKRSKDKRRTSELFPTKDKKKKKKSKKHRKQSSDSSSSSSSSDSSSDDEKADRSRSIRVAMRNMKQVQSIMDEDLTSKWNVLERLVEEHKKKEERKEERKEKVKEPEPDPLINQWMTVSQPQEKDKRLLDGLKDRMKQKHEAEKTKHIELERRRREKEKEERELQERKEKEDREAAEEAEREMKRKEQEEFERIRDKERNQVRFKTNYRRRRTPSRSDEEAQSPHEKHYRHERYRGDSRSERSPEKSRSRSRSQDRSKINDNNSKKKPPGPPSYKKLPFIGRMPLFKNKKNEEKEEKREIKKESYEPVRRTRFQPGNLARAFIPKPDVVCFPKLSSIPPLSIPPPPIVTPVPLPAPDPPKISKESPPKAPPPPKIAKKEEPEKTLSLSEDEMLYADTGNGVTPNMLGQYYQQQYNMMYSQNYDFNNEVYPPSVVSDSHTMPLQPPPLPPDDDLAMLGICADDMAAQSF